MTHRVVVWGAGNVGAPALRAVIAHPGLELAGVVVHSPEKEGRDAGELVGLPHAGVKATRDLESMLATRPDAVFYGATQDLRPDAAHADMLRALEAGANVVTAGLYALLHPPSADPALHERFESACRQGQSTLFSSGIDPGFAMDLLPVVLAGACSDIREIRIVENFNYATYRVPDAVNALIGFGSPMDQTPAMLLPGIPTSVWGGAVRVLADALGLEISDMKEVIERYPLERDAETAVGPLEAGTQGAFRFEVQGFVGSAPRIVVEHVTRIVDDTAPQWPRAAGMGHHQVRILGRPDMVLTLECTEAGGDHVAGGNAAAAARLVNAIPWLCEAEPGLVSGADLPLLSARGLVRTD